MRIARPSPVSSSKPALRPGRFVALFALFFLLGFGVLLAPFVQPAVLAFSRGLVSASGAIIRICGGKVLVEGPILRSETNGFAVEMKDGCNGANVTILLWAAVLAFPSSMLWKAKGLAAGTIAIQAINFVRFISLFYLGQFNMTLFDLAHAYLWEALIMLDAMVVFWLWVEWGGKRAAVKA